ncbi:MAG TPA: iron chelate uptake ABC transporter family permease subunit [Flavobacteriaceae bacterium]|nr:iron chelate uptake ABC transporter family permease subunit [Flavobacteriaceae bacterium]
MLKKRILILTGFTISVILVYLLTFVGNNPDYVLPRRITKIAAMALIACSIGYSSVVFQTITNNRILTPSIMGFEAVFILFQAFIVFLYGDKTFQVIEQQTNFLFSVLLMFGFALILYLALFRKRQVHVYFLLLVGLILGAIFKSMTSFLELVIDPNEFAFVQRYLFASFNNINTNLLGISAIALFISLVLGTRILHKLDVLLLGKEQAITLGINYRRLVQISLFLIAIQVSISTALVGPITFLGILIANLSYEFIPSHKHRHTILGASLFGVILVVGGQFLVEHLFNMNTTISILINFVGGIYFIFLLLKSRRL